MARCQRCDSRLGRRDRYCGDCGQPGRSVEANREGIAWPWLVGLLIVMVAFGVVWFDTTRESTSTVSGKRAESAGSSTPTPAQPDVASDPDTATADDTATPDASDRESTPAPDRDTAVVSTLPPLDISRTTLEDAPEPLRELGEALALVKAAQPSTLGPFVMATSDGFTIVDPEAEPIELMTVLIPAVSADALPIITPQGVLYLRWEDNDLFVDLAGHVYEAPRFVLDAHGLVLGSNGPKVTNVQTGETKEAPLPAGTGTNSFVSFPFSPLLYLETDGETVAWTWEGGWDRVGPGGIGSMELLPRPMAVVRSLCPERTGCQLTAFEADEQVGAVPNVPWQSEGDPSLISVSPTGGQVAFVAPDGRLLLRSRATSQEIELASDHFSGSTFSVHPARWSVDGNVVSILDQGKLVFFAARSGKRLAEALLAGPSGQVIDFGFVDIADEALNESGSGE